MNRKTNWSSFLLWVINLALLAVLLPHTAWGLTFPPREKLEALRAAREYQQPDEFKEHYKDRAGVEGTISPAAFTLGMGQTRC